VRYQKGPKCQVPLCINDSSNHCSSSTAFVVVRYQGRDQNTHTQMASTLLLMLALRHTRTHSCTIVPLQLDACSQILPFPHSMQNKLSLASISTIARSIPIIEHDEAKDTGTGIQPLLPQTGIQAASLPPHCTFNKKKGMPCASSLGASSCMPFSMNTK
jgi:hypothetical protein